MFLENVTNRKLVAFITGNFIGVLLVVLIIFFAPGQLVGLIPAFLSYHAGILAFFVAANAYEDGKKAQYQQALPEVNVLANPDEEGK